MKKLILLESVGIQGKNQREDVLNVQKALNQIAKKIDLKVSLTEDGTIGHLPDISETGRAIGLMQKVLLGFQTPDKLIDVNGKSHQAINEILLGVVQAKDDELSLFLPKIYPEIGLSDEAYEKAAHILSCEVTALKAVSDVESSGVGYFSNGAPCLLFEAQQFSKFTQHEYDESHPDISSRTWDRSLYLGGSKEYTRLQKAMLLNRKAALKSASYGRYQIMGFNYKEAGYDDIEVFVSEMFFSESHHLIAFVYFIKSNLKLLNAIQQKDWSTFARYYNGREYAKNHYDEKLQKAYEQYD